MTVQAVGWSSLPKRFPVGTKYVVEGRSGEPGDIRRFRRYVVLPSGRRIAVPAKTQPIEGGPGTGERSGVGTKARRSSAKHSGPGDRRRRKKSRAGEEPHDPGNVESVAPGEAPQPLTLNHSAPNPGRVSGRGSLLTGTLQACRHPIFVGHGGGNPFAGAQSRVCGPVRKDGTRLLPAVTATGPRPDRRGGSFRRDRRSPESMRSRSTDDL